MVSRLSYQGQQGYSQQNSQQQQQQQLQQQYGQQRGGQIYRQQQQIPYQQQQYGGPMSAYNQQQQQQQRTGSNVVNKPVKLDTYSTTPNGAQVQIRLTSYQNPTMALSNTTTCNCPISYCDYLPQNQQNACSFSFVTVISSAYQSVQYVQSDFNPFFGSISTGNWTTAHTFQMITKPVAIDIFVQHLGVTIDKATGSLLYFGRLTLVDCFIVDLTRFKNNAGGDQSLSLIGTELGTQLQLQLNIQCINGMMGEMCDMTCSTNTIINNNFVVCTNNRTGDYFNCTYNSYTAQVSQCTLCVTSGSAYNGTCIVPLQETYVGVSSAFRIWTIVLGCLLGIAVLLILCLIISYIIVRNRERYEERKYKDTTTYKDSNVYRNGRASRPLLEEDEWTKVSRRPVSTEAEDSYARRTVVSTTVSRQEHQV
ncbi:hypothetical protein Y032_0060g3155 [Ancylostoma ceylanicum]|uniref:Uncharacterized protein n=1 Tax=Ancylostoma ceylanicum TaxID=53326 RepID=A0A016U3H3_9BILA|nr:hypothetical protein Y032_0060g3155 [Ancylostoma ceylanicum]